jgi:hypothetical protein
MDLKANKQTKSKAGRVTQVVERLPSKHEALSSSTPTKTKKS